MRCPGCGRDNRDSAKFCVGCGSPLARRCLECGAAAADGDRFCAECGATVEIATQATRTATPASLLGAPGGEASEPSAERRLVSVLFVDLVGFTPYSAARDHEEVRGLLSRYFERSRSVVERYGGVVEKFIGDAVLAIWGTPSTHEDDAERAVRAALEVLESVEELGRLEGVELAARAGVLTGEAAVQHGLYEEGRVAGDLVNTASRLQTSAAPGTVVVGEATYRAAQGAIAFAPLGELSLKGKDEPVPAFQALRVVARRRGVGRSEALEPPFVGRAEELRVLKDALDAIGRERRPRLVSVTGIPGIGKSRLAWEFLKYVDGLVEDVFWHQGRSPAYGEGITFWALGEMVRMRAGISEGEDPDSARHKLASTLGEFVADEEDRRWIGPRLGYLLGLAEVPPAGHEELFSAWRRFFELIAEQDPVVMVFEDLQWADPGLIDFVESILEWSRHSPILVVTLARPDLLEKRPSWGAAQRNFTAVHLEPFPEAAMRELLKGIVRGLPEQAVEQVLARAEGVPLYAVETVRMLAGAGLLAEHDGGYQPTGEWAARGAVELEIPDSLRALIASRLDALEPAERSLLRDAAVLGQSFTAAGLAALAGGARDQSPEEAGRQGEIEARLRSLVRKELLSLDSDPRSPGRGQYGFVQSLLREVAYSMLSRHDRMAKHLAAAAHFESLGEDELTGAVATHYVAARAAALEPGERRLLAGKAGQWLARAGERALSLGSSEQALAHFEQALELCSEVEERARLLELAASAAGLAGAYERACELYLEAIAGSEAGGDVVAAARLTALLAHPLGSLDRLSECVTRCSQALAVLGESGDPVVRSWLATETARNLVLSGEYDAGLAQVEQALLLAERIGDDARFRRALGVRFLALSKLGRLREARILARTASELAEQAGDLSEHGRALVNAGVIQTGEDPRAALSLCLQALAVARRQGSRGGEFNALTNGVEFALYLGELATARSLLAELEERPERRTPLEAVAVRTLVAVSEALSSDTAAGRARLEPLVVQASSAEFVDIRTTVSTSWAFVELLAGELEDSYRDALAVARTDPSGPNAAEALAVACRAALWLRDAERAAEVRSAMSELHGRWMTALVATADAGLAALAGAVGEAVEGYRRAVEAWRLLESPLDLALCRLDELCLLGAGEGVAAELEEAAGEARQLIVAMGSPSLLALLDGLDGALRAVAR